MISNQREGKLVLPNNLTYDSSSDWWNWLDEKINDFRQINISFSMKQVQKDRLDRNYQEGNLIGLSSYWEIKYS